MEFIEYLILILIVVVMLGTVLMVLLTRFGLLKPKTDEGMILERVKEIQKEEIKAISDTKNVEIANLQRERQVLITQKARSIEKLNKIELQQQELIDTEEGSVENLQQNYTINPIKAVEYIKKLGMNPDALSNPALAPLVWDKLNENKDLALVMGILVPKGGDVLDTSLLSKTSETVKQTEIDPIDKVFAELEKNGQTF